MKRFKGIENKKKKKTYLNLCCMQAAGYHVYQKSHTYVHLTDFIVSSRLLFANFWTLKLLRTMTYLEEDGLDIDGASYCTLFFKKIILITFNRWLPQFVTLLLLSHLASTTGCRTHSRWPIHAPCMAPQCVGHYQLLRHWSMNISC